MLSAWHVLGCSSRKRLRQAREKPHKSKAPRCSTTRSLYACSIELPIPPLTTFDSLSQISTSSRPLDFFDIYTLKVEAQLCQSRSSRPSRCLKRATGGSEDLTGEAGPDSAHPSNPFTSCRVYETHAHGIPWTRLTGLCWSTHSWRALLGDDHPLVQPALCLGAFQPLTLP